MKPAWLKLNEQWQDTGHFGLTIPFLIGALRRFPGQPLGPSANGIDQLRALLTSIRDNAPDGVTMRLYSCDKLQDLALAPVHGMPAHCIPIPSPTRSESALYVEKGTVAEVGDPCQALVSTLWKRYGQHIEAGQFSRRTGAYHPFNEGDEKLIHAAVTRPDDVQPTPKLQQPLRGLG